MSANVKWIAFETIPPAPFTRISRANDPVQANWYRPFNKNVLTFLGYLQREPLLLVLAAGLGLLAFIAPVGVAAYPGLIDWPTIAALAGLLALTKGLEMSGALQWLAQRLIHRMATERAAALTLVVISAILSMWLTNDVALFLVVPLTLGLCRIANMPSTKLVVFEALAVNIGSALTPVGNPQNLFLWQTSKVSFSAFAVEMLPLVGVLSVLLIVLTCLSFAPRPILQANDIETAAIERPLLIAAMLLYVPFIIAMNLGQSIAAMAVVMAVFAVMRWRVIARVDWVLLLTFVLMFLDLRLLTELPVIGYLARQSRLGDATHLYWAGILVSQVVSNVPAAIGLAQFSNDWRVLAYGVNIGGFGLMIGSLANLIAIRLTGDKKAWLMFHAFSVPALFVACALGYMTLSWLKLL